MAEFILTFTAAAGNKRLNLHVEEDGILLIIDILINSRNGAQGYHNNAIIHIKL